MLGIFNVTCSSSALKQSNFKSLILESNHQKLQQCTPIVTCYSIFTRSWADINVSSFLIENLKYNVSCNFKWKYLQHNRETTKPNDLSENELTTYRISGILLKRKSEQANAQIHVAEILASSLSWAGPARHVKYCYSSQKPN